MKHIRNNYMEKEGCFVRGKFKKEKNNTAETVFTEHTCRANGTDNTCTGQNGKTSATLVLCHNMCILKAD